MKSALCSATVMDYIVTSDKGLAMRTEDIVRSWTLPKLFA